MAEIDKGQLDLEPNSKPYLLKRFIADGFDLTCLFILVMLIAFLVEKTPIADRYRTHVRNYEAIEREVLENAEAGKVNDILQNDEEYQSEVFAANLHHYLLVMLEVFIGELVLFAIVPLLNGGSSLGKSMTGILLFDRSRQAKANRMQVLYRFMFLYFESIVLYPWTGIYTFALIAVLRFIVMMTNGNNRTLCDYASGTMYIEKMSYRSFE
ncbi:MAG: RDD family protein [Erysipelotrichaceae bacterium]|nr:RDD family protein [Erysipelotrichaceae bacterium]